MIFVVLNKNESSIFNFKKIDWIWQMNTIAII